MTGAPIFYDYQNAIISQTTPNTVHVKNVGLTRFFQRYLLQKAISVFWNCECKGDGAGTNYVP